MAICSDPAASQPAGVVGRPIDCTELPEQGPDPRAIGLGPALAAAERYELAIDDLSYALAWAEREGDPVHVPILKEIVEAYRCGVGNAALALLAIGAAGEPADYFLGYVTDARRDDALAAYAIGALDARDDRVALPALEAAVAALPEGYRWRGPRGFQVGAALGNFRSGIGSDSLWQRGPTADYINFTASLVQGRAADGYASGGRFLLNETDATRYSDAGSGRDRRRLWALARVYPTAVREAILRQADRTAAFAAEQGRDPADVPLIREAAVELATATAFPTTAPPLPPAVTSAAVTVSACVERPVVGSGPFTAVFSYASAEPAAFRVPYGQTNALVAPAASRAVSPEVFFPAAVPNAPGRTFRVAAGPAETVTWTLLGRTVTASASSRLCSAPPVPLCAGRAATVYVEAGRVVGGPLAGTLFAGRLLGTDASDVILGTDAADAIDALAGDDTVCAGDGNDAVRVGTGQDTVDGGPGTDGCDDAETATTCEGTTPALTDVRPVLECVAPDGAGFVAYFGYENRGTRAGRVPYSANNRITPAALDRAQPDLFGLPGVVANRPGRTPFYPGHAFTVRFAAGQTVVWKLFTRTSTASASSARCPAP